jgi:hypothetical protein
LDGRPAVELAGEVVVVEDGAPELVVPVPLCVAVGLVCLDA